MDAEGVLFVYEMKMKSVRRTRPRTMMEMRPIGYRPTGGRIVWLWEVGEAWRIQEYLQIIIGRCIAAPFFEFPSSRSLPAILILCKSFTESGLEQSLRRESEE